ncbi:hypothetical protein [Nostoc sp. TCL26-01]|uniref:hypothetical protein n=1 Tax=Nostoc sp. TCL26-01 TaxID=2576904 RepID=UPI0015BE07BF|nr:hypothetical protein [Nostoc sp. TCL26-01]QLE55662.1 hypothetical protein FD725_09115 [Nostoc sp. TCL26-01]
MSYCQGKSKATVKITWSKGDKESVTSEYPAVDVFAELSYSYRITYHHDVVANSNNFVDSYDSFKDLGVLEEPISYQLVSSSDKKIVDLVVTSGNPTKTTTIVMARNSSYGSNFSNLQLVQSELYTEVNVVDQKGTVKILRPGNATWIVTCDDDCKPGEIKCEHPGYPGFCCIPCQATASKINNLAARVGR